MIDIEEVIKQIDVTNLPLDERETTFTITADDRGTWYCFSNDSVMIRRVFKKEAELVKYDKYGVAFKLEGSQVRVYDVVKISDEERERRSRAAKENFHGESFDEAQGS